MSTNRVTVWGIPCPGEPSDERLTVAYRVWFAAYRLNQQARHHLGLHQKPRTYSIAPRCDWCGHRSPAQRAVADRNWRAMTRETDAACAAETEEI